MLGMPVNSTDPDSCGSVNPLINGNSIDLAMKHAGLTPSGNRIGQMANMVQPGSHGHVFSLHAG